MWERTARWRIYIIILRVLKLQETASAKVISYFDHDAQLHNAQQRPQVVRFLLFGFYSYWTKVRTRGTKMFGQRKIFCHRLHTVYICYFSTWIEASQSLLWALPRFQKLPAGTEFVWLHNLILRHVSIKKRFFSFLSRFVRVWLQE